MNHIFKEIYENIANAEQADLPFIDIIYKGHLYSFVENLDFILPILWANSKDLEPNYLNFLSGINRGLNYFMTKRDGILDAEFNTYIRNIYAIREYLNREILVKGLQVTHAEIEKSIFLKDSERQTFEIPENDYSGKNELKPKEKLIILDKLGVVKFLTDKLDVSDNATHLAEILGAITGIDNQKGTLTGYCNYLIRPDNSNKNSPYFSETTVKKANQIYNTFNIKDKTG